MSAEYINMQKEFTIHLLPDADQKLYHEAKKELRDLIDTNKNICDKCVHKNGYILKNQCSKIYLPAN